MRTARRIKRFAAVAGVFVGRMLVDTPRANETELHALLHSEAKLSAVQERKLHLIEARFSARREALELEMRAANIRLAQAIEAEHGYGPRVTKAIDETHEVMGELQKETMVHTLAMRAVLTPEQAAKFDDTVVQSLTQDAR